MDDRMVANLALLLPKGASDALDRRLAELDEEFGSRLNFRCVGPLPPYSFATVEVSLPSFEAIDRARRALSLGDKAGLAEIKSAYRRQIRQVHPDLTATPRVDEGQRDQTDRRVQDVDELCRSPTCGSRRRCRWRNRLSLRSRHGRGLHPGDGASPGVAGRARGNPVMTTAKPRRAPADQTVVYVYGVARAPRGRQSAPPRLEGIVPDAPVHPLVHGNLMAFVSAVPAAQFGPERISFGAA